MKQFLKMTAHKNIRKLESFRFFWLTDTFIGSQRLNNNNQCICSPPVEKRIFLFLEIIYWSIAAVQRCFSFY